MHVLRCRQFHCKSFEGQAWVTLMAVLIHLRRLGSLDHYWERGGLQLLACDVSLGMGPAILHFSLFPRLSSRYLHFLDSLAKWL